MREVIPHVIMQALPVRSRPFAPVYGYGGTHPCLEPFTGLWIWYRPTGG